MVIIITITSTAEGVEDFTFTGGEQISITAAAAYWLALSWNEWVQTFLPVLRSQA